MQDFFVSSINISTLPKRWIFTGCPNRARHMAVNICGGNPEPIHQDGYLSIWAFEYAGELYGIAAHGMGKPSIEQAVRRISALATPEWVVRVGTAGSYSDSVNGKLVVAKSALDLESRKVYFSSLSNGALPVPLVDCVTTDFFYKTQKVDRSLGDVEDMETSKLYELSREFGYECASILLSVNDVDDVSGNSGYSNQVYPVMVNLAVKIINLKESDKNAFTK